MAKKPIRSTEIKVNVRQLEKTIGPDIKPVTDFLIDVGGKIISVKFNEHERAFIEKNPISSVAGALCAALALTSTISLPGTLNGEGDAMRHCLLGACMAKLLGTGTASTILNNHEIGQNNPYDANNNEVALNIGTSGALNLWGACQEASKNGKLQYSGSQKPPTAVPSTPTNPGKPPANAPTNPSQPSTPTRDSGGGWK